MIAPSHPKVHSADSPPARRAPRPRWSRGDDAAFHQAHAAGGLTAVLARFPGRTETALTRRAQHLGLSTSKGQNKAWTRQDEATLHQLWPIATRAQIQKALPDRRWTTIQARASKLGLIRQHIARYPTSPLRHHANSRS
jgi:hypothetical protein